MWGIMSKVELDNDGYLRLVTGDTRQVVARLDGERVWFYCRWTKCEVPITWEELQQYHERMKQ